MQETCERTDYLLKEMCESYIQNRFSRVYIISKFYGFLLNGFLNVFFFQNLFYFEFDLF